MIRRNENRKEKNRILTVNGLKDVYQLTVEGEGEGRGEGRGEGKETGWKAAPPPLNVSASRQFSQHAADLRIAQEHQNPRLSHGQRYQNISFTCSTVRYHASLST